MLFSNDTIAKYINEHYEPAWQSVRKAAVVRIDFGNGKTITRTLNGNIATYFCLPDGSVMDVIPGVYDPQVYMERLAQGLKLHQWAVKPPRRVRRETDEDRRKRIVKMLQRYHTEQAQALRTHKEPKVIVYVPPNPRSIIRTEGGLKLLLKSSLRGTRRSDSSRALAAGKKAAEKDYKLPREFARRAGRLKPEMLKKDSQYNESVRRLQVHDYLVKHAGEKPAGMTKAIYKDILKTDLDDPYLGLGNVLFGTYPFQDKTEGEKTP